MRAESRHSKWSSDVILGTPVCNLLSWRITIQSKPMVSTLTAVPGVAVVWSQVETIGGKKLDVGSCGETRRQSLAPFVPDSPDEREACMKIL